jgi:hypothetical protein
MPDRPKVKRISKTDSNHGSARLGLGRCLIELPRDLRPAMALPDPCATRSLVLNRFYQIQISRRGVDMRAK